MNEESVAATPNPRSAGPLIGALAVAVVVVVAAVVWFFVGAGTSTQEQDAIEACEIAAQEAGLGEIVRGDIAGPEAGVYDIAWEFADGTFGGCEATVADNQVTSVELVGDAAEDLEE
ncbi:hypothetical protein [Demequina sediminicola]|uniref:hypothetical protein n=1 Tax=Demequina sediminicola TaxID=1095026 RepID=UPI0007814921|nr:hypothetical protein [Demequina sediminicola]